MLRIGASSLSFSLHPFISRYGIGIVARQLQAPRCRQSTTPSRGRDDSMNTAHSRFLSQAPPNAKWNKDGFSSMNGDDEPTVDDLEGVAEGRGKILPTSSHLFKLILPLGNLSHRANTRTKPSKPETRGDVKSKVPPTVILLHPSQPLSHVSNLIKASLTPALPIISFRSMSRKGQAFQWSDSTDIGDFIRDAARSAQFFICLTYEPSKHLEDVVLKHDTCKFVATNDEGGTKDTKEEDPTETIIEVEVPTFADRTRYLRRKLKFIEGNIAKMEGLKQLCEKEAHRGARRMAVTGFGGLVVYWAAVARLTFWDYGWDVMEPVTYLSGLSMVVLGYLWFLYQGREVSYSTVLAQSISKRRDALYKSNGFDVELWADLVTERRTIRKEIGRIAEDYEESRTREYGNASHEALAGDGGNRQEKVDVADPGTESELETKKEENVGERLANKANRED